jgi:hypothetical protein
MSDGYPPFIFGMHDRGGEHLMLEKSKRGWVLVTEALGADPNNYSGSNYTDLSTQGLGVIVRLNHGYGTAGTIPHSSQYDNFARRCGNFVQASPGCHLWIIGNEMNLAWERPGGPDGQVITPELYAICFNKCRAEIRRRPGHSQDQVIPGAVGPWNTQTQYPGNPSGDWVQYFADILGLLGQNVDGIAIHTYTHGQDPNLVFSEAKMNPPFQDHHWHFRAYRDFMAAIPGGLRNRPVYVTETDQYTAWRNANTGWVRNAYQEIDNWGQNPSHQPIQALILFRWIIGNPNDPQQVGWAIENKPGVQDDFRDAMNNNYQVVLPDVKPQYLAAWLQVNAPTVMQPGATARFSVQVRNDGRQTWSRTGSQSVRLGHRWIAKDGSTSDGIRTDLPHSVTPGQTVTLPSVSVQAPDRPGYYTLKLDLVEGATGWFEDHGSPPWMAEVRIGARYRVGWLNVSPPSHGEVGETVTVPVRIRNNGALTWVPTGDNPFNLTYKWLDTEHNEVVADGLRTPLGREVAPLEEVALDARVQFPADPGTYVLMMDMVHEFVVWFHWMGSPVYEVQVTAKPAVQEYATEWLDYAAPGSLPAGATELAYLEVKNVGAQPWPRAGDDAVRLGARWFDAQGQEVPLSVENTWPMPRTIEPGEVAIFRETAYVAPEAPGGHTLVWDLLQADVWLSTKGAAVKEQAVQIIAAEYGVEWEVLEPWPDWLPPGEEQRTSLRLRNVGTKPWAAGGAQPVHLAYNWFALDGNLTEPWDTFRILLPNDVQPGDSVELIDILFQTPSVPDRYTLRWDLVEEGQAWFFRQGAAPLEILLEISDRSLYVPWTAQASHNQNDVGLALDNDPATFWDSSAAQEPGMWFQVDLGRALVLDRVKVSSPGRGFAVGYKIELSEDGQDWHLVAQADKNWTDLDVAFAPCRARYLRLEQTGRPYWGATWMISEIAVSMTQPWAGARASHYTSDAHKAIDARPQTYWTTRAVRQKPDMWFELDMGGQQRIERVTLVQTKNESPRGYVIQVSTDGQQWQEVRRNNDNWNTLDTGLGPVTARYVRVKTTKSSSRHPWAITEFVVRRSSPTWLRGWEQ